MILKLAVTGHRHWKYLKDTQRKIYGALDTLLSLYNQIGIPPHKVIMMHGCALGVDTWFGEYAYGNRIKLHLYLPFPRDIQVERGRFNRRQKAGLDAQINYASKVVTVNKTYSTYGYQKRNIALVNDCDVLTSFFTRSRSGSGNCVRYALEKEVKHLDLRTFEELSGFKRSIHHLTNIM